MDFVLLCAFERGLHIITIKTRSAFTKTKMLLQGRIA